MHLKQKEEMIEMNFPNRHIVEKLRKYYPVGTRVQLVAMCDTQSPPIGTIGIVQGVDDTGSLIVHWDNGSRLHIVYGVDYIKKV